VSVFDLQFYYFLKVFKDFDKDAFNKYPKFKTLFEAVEKIPFMEVYLASDRYQKAPFMPPTMVQWNTII